MQTGKQGDTNANVLTTTNVDYNNNEPKIALLNFQVRQRGSQADLANDSLLTENS